HLSLSTSFFNDSALSQLSSLSYTTLFRSARRFLQARRGGARRPVHLLHRGLRVRRGLLGAMSAYLPSNVRVVAILIAALASVLRSEEHTSELQSRENLVCRLLLEKKKISQ